MRVARGLSGGVAPRSKRVQLLRDDTVWTQFGTRAAISVLALQRSAGNAAVAQLLVQRSCCSSCAKGGSCEERSDAEDTVQRQATTPAAAAAPACAVFADFSGFNRVRLNTTTAARVSTRLVLDSGVIKAQFQRAGSWVNENQVPASGQRAPGDAKEVARCKKAFKKSTTAFYEVTPGQGCPAAVSTPLRATDAGECETVLGQGMDVQRRTDINTRLLKHEQYHMRMACSLAQIGNALIARGVRPGQALKRMSKANAKLQGKYDKASVHGCDASGQASFEGNIDDRTLPVPPK